MRDTECSSVERFKLPDGFSIDDHFQGHFGIHRGGEPTKVVIEFDPRVVEYVMSRKVHPTQELKALPSGGVEDSRCGSATSPR